MYFDTEIRVTIQHLTISETTKSSTDITEAASAEGVVREERRGITRLNLSSLRSAWRLAWVTFGGFRTFGCFFFFFFTYLTHPLTAFHIPIHL